MKANQFKSRTENKSSRNNLISPKNTTQFKDNRLIASQTKAIQKQMNPNDRTHLSGIQRKVGRTTNLFPVQRVKIGGDDVTNLTDLTEKINYSKNPSLSNEEVLAEFNARLDNFPDATATQLTNFLNSKTSRIKISLTDEDRFYEWLAKHYIETYFSREDSGFTDNLEGIDSNTTYTDLIGEDYVEDVEDGASVKDKYDKTLACTLYAILELKPNLLGANNPKELHQIFRSNPVTSGYDNDEEVAKIRISAGLNSHKTDSTNNSVSKFTSTASKTKKYIIDPGEEAHTFVLKYENSKWIHIDNDNPSGKTPKGSTAIRFYWNA